jgi:hypothetical protein
VNIFNVRLYFSNKIQFSSWVSTLDSCAQGHMTEFWFSAYYFLLVIQMLPIILYYNYHLLLSQGSFLVPILFSNQWSAASLRLQDCSTFLVMCDVPSTAVFFCREFTECFLGTISNFFFFSLLISLAPVTTDTTKHFILHICWISIPNFYIWISLQFTLVLNYCLRVLLHLSISKSYLVLNYYV